MIDNWIRSIFSGIKRLLSRWFEKITEINRKYAKPRIKMTPMTSVAMLLLRIYLLLLVAILFYKFFTILTGK
jgi:uncharacterized membrane protein YidH (DUF202 family)